MVRRLEKLNSLIILLIIVINCWLACLADNNLPDDALDAFEDDYFVSRVEMPRAAVPEEQQLQRFDMGMTIYNYSESDVSAIYDVTLISHMGDDGQARLVVNNLIVNTGSSDTKSDERHTTFSARWPPNFSGKGCITAIVLDNEPILGAERIPPELKEASGDLLIVFGFTIESISREFLEFLETRRVLVAFLRKNRPISDGLRGDLYSRGLGVIDNLAIPDNLDVTQTGITYFGFLMVFTPFNNRTSRTYLGAFTEFVNLAELTLLTATDELKDLCSNRAIGNPYTLNNDWLPESIPIFPGLTRPHLSHRRSSNGKFYDWLTFSDHFGTHIDVPFHFVYNGYATDSLPSRFTLAPCIKVVDQTTPVNGSVTLAAFKFWERKHNRTIPEGAIVLVETGHWRKWQTPEQYGSGYPGVDVKAADWLLRERKIVGLGIDSSTLDSSLRTANGAFPTHLLLSENDAIALVNLGGRLERFPENGGTCLVVFFRAERGTGSPAAVFGLADGAYSTGTSLHTILHRLLSLLLQTSLTLLSIIIINKNPEIA